MVVWLAEYPRCGVTFLRMVLAACYGQQTYSVYAETRPEGMEHKRWPMDHRGEGVSFVKTHFPMNWEAVEGPSGHPHEKYLANGDKAILLLRDPRDALLSHARLVSRTLDGQVTVRDALARMIEQDGYRQVFDYWTDRGAVVVRFDDLVRAPVAIVGNALTALGFDVGEAVSPAPTFEQLHATDSDFFRHGTSRWTQDFPLDLLEKWFARSGHILVKCGFDIFPSVNVGSE